MIGDCANFIFNTFETQRHEDTEAQGFDLLRVFVSVSPWFIYLLNLRHSPAIVNSILLSQPFLKSIHPFAANDGIGTGSWQNFQF
jgi:hypothetical protein